MASQAMQILIDDAPTEEFLDRCIKDVITWIGIAARARCHNVHSSLLCRLPDELFHIAMGKSMTDPSFICSFVARTEMDGIPIGPFALDACREWLSRNWKDLDFHPGHEGVTIRMLLDVFKPKLKRPPYPMGYECTIEKMICRERSIGNLAQITATGQRDHAQMADERIFELGRKIPPPSGHGIIFIDGSKSMIKSQFGPRWCDLAFAAIGSMQGSDVYSVHSSIEPVQHSINGMNCMRKMSGNAYRAGSPFNSMMDNDSAPDWMAIVSDSEAVPNIGTQEHADMMRFMQKFPDTLVTFCNLDSSSPLPDCTVISPTVYLHGFSDRTPALMSVANDKNVRKLCED